ncbi:unnamed protein product [Phyllotreta striolata]|uniref:Methyltransferase-like protein 17, mitochondrial n=1 Tax=Phyllotreta striolata TaxID=444603 RepID=A0A9N9XU84_PHYSR|nr:unnamed protein product [Phyllotreta striolata]
MLTTKRIIRRLSTKPKPLVTPDKTVIDNVNNNVYKFRKHPGIIQAKTIILPDRLIKSTLNVLQEHPAASLFEASQKLARHLTGRKICQEESELNEKLSKIQAKVLNKYLHVDDDPDIKTTVQNEIQRLAGKRIYNWKPIKYDSNNSLLYLIARMAPEYAVLFRIFAEIRSRHPDFKPRGLLDFGSGTGSVTWAANSYWKPTLIEYFNIDSSREMNDLAELLLKGGHGNSQLPLTGVFYRQFFPVNAPSYDLVCSAYSLFELPSMERRLEILSKLWRKTDRFLVIVEQGTNAGFKLVNEARDFIISTEDNTRDYTCKVFSPCPHELECPRFLIDDGTPCNFEVTYHSMPFGRPSTLNKERYSYVVLEKRRRESVQGDFNQEKQREETVEGDFDLEKRRGNTEDGESDWPRLVRPTLVKSKHTICRMCCPDGKLREVIFTKSKHGKVMHWCARASKWGDLLPVKVEAARDDGDDGEKEEDEVV